MAQAELPHGTFVRADVLEYSFPTELDVIFAFASLLHLDREQITSSVRESTRCAQ
jgi:hypothetical protein